MKKNTNKPKRKVYKFDLDGNLLAEYSCAEEAATKNTCKYHAVSYACRNKTKVGENYYGYENIFYKRLETF